MTDDDLDPLFVMTEQIRPFVSWMTGLRAQFIEQGWPPEQAGQAALQVHRMLLQGQGNS